MKRFTNLSLALSIALLLLVELLLTFVQLLDWKDGLTLVVLTITAAFVAAQTEATYRILESSQVPGVEVAMVYNKRGKRGTSIQILNKSKIPALVWTTIKVEVDGKKLRDRKAKELLESPRFTGKEPFHIGFRSYVTSPDFLRKLTENKSIGDVRVSLVIEVAPTFNKKLRFLSEKKTYKFIREKLWWEDMAWGMADEIHEKFLRKAKKNRSRRPKK